MYAFFLDIDGTIFDSKIVAQEDIDGIARARAAGHQVFINTARAYIGLPEQVYGLPVNGFVCSYGTEVVVDGKFISHSFIPREKVLKIAKYAFDHGRELYFEGEIRIDINLDHEGGLNPKNMDEFEEMLGESGICRFLLFGGATDEEKATVFAGFDFRGIEAAPTGYTKALGIRIVEQHCCIPHESTVAIGDTDSDIDMIRYAAVGISMGNGTPGLKACAKYVTKPFFEFGVAHAIDRILAGDLESLENKK